MPNFFPVNISSVPRGNKKAGPAPQVNPFFGWEGERNAVANTSPIPDCDLPAPVILYCAINGKITREIKFNLGVMVMGTTGCTFIVLREPLNAPIP